MKITDEILSAFLDAALSEAEMEQVRQQLLQNDQLTGRLADLAMVDSLVQQHYAQIDQRPLPADLLQLIDGEAQPACAEVIDFPWWRRAQQQLQRHAAAVACIALFAGYGVSQWQTGSTTSLALSTDVSRYLNSIASGESHMIDEHKLTARLSFINQQGEFCRQYSLQTHLQFSENIACRRAGAWQQLASLSLSSVNAGDQYQTASGGILDNVLDNIMAGAPLTMSAEQPYLTSNIEQ